MVEVALASFEQTDQKPVRSVGTNPELPTVQA